MSDGLYAAILKSQIKIRKAAEIGVFSFETSALRTFIEKGQTCDLYEAVPEYCDEIKSKVKEFKNTTLNCYAVSNFEGVLTLCMAGPSTFSAAQNQAPAINHDGLDKHSLATVTVNCRNFATVDPGDYDLVSIDTEGSEFDVLSVMVSRPRVIAIETQSRDYVNPKLGAITDWMVANNYKVWLWNDTDTVFIRGEVPRLRFFERLMARWHNFRYFAGRL